MRQPLVLPIPPEPDPHLDPLALAVVAEVVERGEMASVAGVLSREGVSAEDFERRFTSLEDCAVDAFERFIAAFEVRVGLAFDSQDDWRTSLRACAYETADFLAENPQLMSFGGIGVLGLKSELARVRREEAIMFCGDLIDLGRHEPEADVGDDKATAMFAIGSIIQLLTHRLQADEPIEPHALVPEMMYRVVRAYLGEEAASEELVLPRPSTPRPSLPRPLAASSGARL